MMLTVFITGSVSLLLSGCAGKPAEPTPAIEKTTAVSGGQAIFLNNCAKCHHGAGDPPGPDDRILYSPNIADEKTFIHYLRNPNPGMPPFSEVRLSTADAQELFGYIQKLKPAR
jgi:mono/diheme cytochrome c family protein